MNIKFIQVNDLNSDHTREAFTIYLKSFPANERQKEEVILQRLNSGREKLFAGLKENKVISIGLVFNLSNSKFVLLDYVAVSEYVRRSGTGTQFMQRLVECYYKAHKQMILEVEDPSDGENIEERQRRVNFYRKLGAKYLLDVHYVLPALDGATTTKMILMIFEQENFTSLPRHEVEKLLLDLYVQVYSKNADDPMVTDAIKQLPETIKLQ